jgi:hypothetical protein
MVDQIEQMKARGISVPGIKGNAGVRDRKYNKKRGMVQRLLGCVQRCVHSTLSIYLSVALSPARPHPLMHSP